MKIFNMYLIGAVVVTALALSLTGPMNANAATTPSLGAASTFGVLSTTFTKNSGNTAITGDVGYTGVPSGSGTYTVSGGTDYGSGAPYSTAGTDQGSALVSLNAQTCTHTFPAGAINLATDTTHGQIGVYAPGVYCTQTASGAMSIGTAGITLSGAGTYIFRTSGPTNALTTVDNSQVTLANGASSCDVFWTPTAATTLGANTTFVGTIIDDAGITIGSTTTLRGRALSFASAVTTDTDIINSTCAVASVNASYSPASGTINVVKNVINDGGGTMTVADFPLFVANIQYPSNTTPVTSGMTNSTFYAPATYVVTETANANYTRAFSGDCDSNGKVSLQPGTNKLCVITNNDIAVPIVPPVPPIIDVVKVPSPLSLPAGPGSVTYTYTLRNIGTVPVTNITMVGDTCSPIILVSGDTNSNAILETTETWVHTCTTTLSATHTNIVTATGWANGISAVDVANATVVVGAPIIPPLIHITKVPNPLALSAGGGVVTYTKKVTNPGAVTLHNVNITDDKCSPLVYISGDTNTNSMLETTETWTYTCRTNLTQTTTNTVVATGDANGLTARDFAIATVVVSAAVPKLPNTGLHPNENNIPWNVIVSAGILAILASLYFTRKKQTA